MKRLALILVSPLAVVALLKWNESRTPSRTLDRNPVDPLLALRGSGRHVWANQHADEFVRNLREDRG